MTRTLSILLVLPLMLYLTVASVAIAEEEILGSDSFVGLLIGSESERRAALANIEENWRPEYAVRIVESLGFQRNPGIRRELVRVLESKTQQSFGVDRSAWFEWIWSQPEIQSPNYAQFKSDLYRNIDPKFAEYFSNDRRTLIRLDEVRWGGVAQDGIPPLRDPKMIPASGAKYLGKRDIVFGIEINGDVRAYPKRILAWHEMFTDTVGGVPIAGVYCTLCGTVIIYETEHQGTQHTLGTSGFLYRSNKLMYDRETQSLWNTFTGSPVIGPLVGKGIELPSRPVVTTRWADWKKRHPESTVLSLDTGHQRDYSEGAAYKEYFATDELMFNTPKLDTRLKNKDEVLTMTGNGTDPLALSAKFLAKNTVYETEIAGSPIVVLTDPSGANRVYETGGFEFDKFDGNRTVRDRQGGKWTLYEDRLEGPGGKSLARVAAQRAFWFGWYAQFPETRLVK